MGGLSSGFSSFDGIIDELRFSEGALTPAQMQPVP
ncbi:LamG domain-containing protein [Enhygromyxa salina]|nr:LamG domain-containing protein [Enhygromyxa salina]